VATFRKRGAKWRAEVYLAGVRESATRATKAEAAAWAREREADILAHRQGRIVARSVRQALSRYALEVSPAHRGARWEQIRLAKLARSLPFIDRLLAEVRTADVAAWRDSAIAGGLAPATVRRELVLLRGVLEAARREWGWLRENPMSGLRWPAAGRPRDRRISDDELDQLLLALGYDRGTAPTRASHRVAIALLLALETAMRAGELCGLTPADVDRAGRAATLAATKNGDRRRVPLSRAALDLVDLLPAGATLLGLSPQALDVAFRRARDRTGIVDLHWHDSRHEAITRLAQRLPLLDLARMIGHRDLRSLQIYYNPTPAEIAARLDG
jgi:integrase